MAIKKAHKIIAKHVKTPAPTFTPPVSPGQIFTYVPRTKPKSKRRVKKEILPVKDGYGMVIDEASSGYYRYNQNSKRTIIKFHCQCIGENTDNSTQVMLISASKARYVSKQEHNKDKENSFWRKQITVREHCGQCYKKMIGEHFDHFLAMVNLMFDKRLK